MDVVWLSFLQKVYIHIVITLSFLLIKEISEILSILAACLHLGNIEFEEVGDETDGVAIRDDDSIRHGI